MTGGILFVSGKPVSFCIASILSRNVTDVHFEKCLSGFDRDGGYTVINNEFSKTVRTEYLNREEDLGIQGLQKAKLSYYPEMILEKFKVEISPVKKINTYPTAFITLNLKDNEWPFIGVTHERLIARAIVVDEENYFYFVRVNRNDGFGIGDFIETSGGGVEPGEDLETAIKRELKEELGAQVDVICKLAEVNDFYNKIGRRNLNNYFLCKVNSFGSKNLTQQELTDFKLSTLRLTYEQAVEEYKKHSSKKWGRLLLNRELPVLEHAKKVLEEIKQE